MQMPKINIVISCGLLSVTDPIEIDRFRRFKAQLENINDIGYNENIKWIFCELGKQPKLESTIKNKVPFAKYIYYNSEKFNQINIWKYVENVYNDYDFIIFSHSDILFSKNLNEALNSRITNPEKNYYAFRFQTNNPYAKIPTACFEHTFEKEDYGYRYILEKFGKKYNTKYKSLVVDSSDIAQYANSVPESFMCISKKNIQKIFPVLYPEVNFNNDVVIRDLSVTLGIESEWINDSIILVHMRGIDDNTDKESGNIECHYQIIQKYPELQHYGLWKFENRFIPFLQKEECKFVYENFIKEKAVIKNESDLRKFIYGM
jgi:hypothetical protein